MDLRDPRIDHNCHNPEWQFPVLKKAGIDTRSPNSPKRHFDFIPISVYTVHDDSGGLNDE